MKKLSILIALLILASCANENKSKEAIESFEVAMEQPTAIPANAYQLLIESKLKDISDKQSLIEKHPDFKTAITDIKLQGIVENVLLLNQVDSYKKVDTVSLVVSYRNLKETDTLQAYVSSSLITIDGEEIKTTSVRFGAIN